jgi:hypothetical protein
MKPLAIPDFIAPVNAVDIVAPVEVLALMLAARYGKTTLKCAVKINDWLWYPKSWRIPPCVHAAAEDMEKLLRRHIREGAIRLRGDLKAGDPPLEIDRAHCLVGEFRVFDQTLTISVPGHRTPACVYRNVFCVTNDVMRIVNEISKNHCAPIKGVLSFDNVMTLKQAPRDTIRKTIRSVYDDAKNKGEPPPNINKLSYAVLPLLEKRGYEASGRQIKEIGNEKEFKGRRNPRGQRLT